MRYYDEGDAALSLNGTLLTHSSSHDDGQLGLCALSE